MTTRLRTLYLVVAVASTAAGIVLGAWLWSVVS